MANLAGRLPVQFVFPNQFQQPERNTEEVFSDGYHVRKICQGSVSSDCTTPHSGLLETACTGYEACFCSSQGKAIFLPQLCQSLLKLRSVYHRFYASSMPGHTLSLVCCAGRR